MVLYCKTGGDRWTVRLTVHLSPSDLCLIFSFVFVLHVQFCKAKSRCTLSQVVHQQHSVTVSYHSLLQYSAPYLLPSPPLLSPYVHSFIFLSSYIFLSFPFLSAFFLSSSFCLDLQKNQKNKNKIVVCHVFIASKVKCIYASYFKKHIPKCLTEQKTGPHTLHVNSTNTYPI